MGLSFRLRALLPHAAASCSRARKLSPLRCSSSTTSVVPFTSADVPAASPNAIAHSWLLEEGIQQQKVGGHIWSSLVKGKIASTHQRKNCDQVQTLILIKRAQ
jgi:hypothetical protein